MATGRDKEEVYRSVNKFTGTLTDTLAEKNVKVLAVYLFGSYAKDKAGEWSDIDIAVVTDKFIGDDFDFSLFLMKLAKKIDVDLEPHPFLIEDFNEFNPFAVDVIKTGKVVFGSAQDINSRRHSDLGLAAPNPHRP